MDNKLITIMTPWPDILHSRKQSKGNGLILKLTLISVAAAQTLNLWIFAFQIFLRNLIQKSWALNWQSCIFQYVSVITSAREVTLSLDSICLLVSWFVSRITKKLLCRFLELGIEVQFFHGTDRNASVVPSIKICLVFRCQVSVPRG